MAVGGFGDNPQSVVLQQGAKSLP
jgi:hypothetical protein